MKNSHILINEILQINVNFHNKKEKSILLYCLHIYMPPRRTLNFVCHQIQTYKIEIIVGKPQSIIK